MLGKHSKLFFFISFCALIVAIVLASWGFPKIVKRQVQKNVQIENSSKMFEKWRKLPMPLTFKVYVFNISNPEEVSEGEKPRLQEIGPYVYKEYREKTVLGYGENDTIKYTLKKSFVFDAQASGTLSEHDELTVINLTYMGVILTVNGMMPAILGSVNKALEIFFGNNLTDPFMRVKVKDLLFDGIFLNCEADNSALSLVCGTLRAKRPTTMRLADDGKGYYFSMFGHWNNTPLGPFDMVRGTENVYELGHIVGYKDRRTMKEWGDPYCGMINGSDSSIFPPIDENNVPQKLYTYDPDICRSLSVDLMGKRSIFNMSAYYYELTETALASKSVNPSNKCFCRKNWSGSHDGCLLMGVLNLMPCQGAPALISLPHFYLASEEVREYIYYGLSPDKEKHKSFIYLDPVTGVVMKGAQRIQFNIELRNMGNLPQLAKVRTGIFPLLWFDEGAEITESIKEELRHSHTLLGYVETVRWTILVIAFAAALISGVALARSGAVPHCRRNNSINFITRPSKPTSLSKH
ncbi:Sensory neuron membrane protein 1 [Papilio xuthus]|uniref:Sensory neuron membrane protein 1 n=1 Tax=Papilio xuthus TaxID=66420 RepID=A0A194PCR4_PAPXU|nr:Sensory neuron membrane protein 1 [Papilio xuthus]